MRLTKRAFRKITNLVREEIKVSFPENVSYKGVKYRKNLSREEKESEKLI